MIRRVTPLLGMLLTAASTAWAGTRPAVTVARIERAPTVDQFVAAFTDSGFSSPLTRVQGFIQLGPTDGAPVSERTDVYLGRDDRAFYLVFVCFDREMRLIRSRLVGRDRIPDDDDNVAVNIDTFHDYKHAYGFEVNAAGVQLDGLYSESAGWDFSYDMVWSSDVRRTPQGYVVLMTIPFAALRFAPHNPDGWGLLLYRGIPRKNEDALWPRFTMAIAGRMVQAADLRGVEDVAPGGGTQLVPYTSFTSARSLDALDPGRPRFASERQERGGLDAKLVVHRSVVVDATLHPDFSQVESDQPQETLNQRFEVFFPELRPFFLENASYFSTPLNLVFTRRIADPSAGGRVTGKLGHYAFGALVSDDRSPGDPGSPASALAPDRALFSAVRVSRDVGSDNSAGVILTSRTDRATSNVVGGFDGRVSFARCWVASAQSVTSVTDDGGARRVGQATSATLRRAGLRWTLASHYDDRTAGFRSDLGFINRVDIRDASSTLSYRFRPEGRWAVVWGPDLSAETIRDHQGVRLGSTWTPQLTLQMTRGTAFTVFHSFASEVLRPGDAAALPTSRAFDEDRSGITLGSSVLARCVFSGAYSDGRGIDFVPPAGAAPEAARVRNASAAVSIRATDALTIDGTCILTNVRDLRVRADHFNEHIVRAEGNYQFTRAASVRTIVQYHSLLPNATFTAAELTRQLTADLLITYLVHPYTALYVGYTEDSQNLDPALRPTVGGIARTPDGLLNDARQLFIKVSYLIRP